MNQKLQNEATILPHILSTGTILFNFEIVGNSNSCRNFFLTNKPNFCCGNYSREETIQGQKL